MSIVRSRAVTVALAAGLVVAGGATGAVADGLIQSDDIQNNTIKSKDIQNNAIKSKDLRDNLVRSRDMRDGTIKSRDLKDGKIRMKDLREGVQDRIEQPGPVGPQGAAGVSGYEVDGFYTRNDGSGLGPALAAGEVKRLVAECADGKVALSGGFTNGNTVPGSDLTVRESAPAEFVAIEGDPEGSVRASAWAVTLENETDQVQHAQVFVVCAAVG